MAILSRFLTLSLLLLPSVLAQTTPAPGSAAAITGPATEFSKAKGTKFLLDGTNLRRFAGMNAFYLTKQPEPLLGPPVKRPDNVLDALTKMKASGVQVVRVWGHAIFGSPDATTPVPEFTVYLQRFIPGPRGPDKVNQGTWEINEDAEFGLGRLDHVINTADMLGMKIIVVLANYFNGDNDPPGKGEGGLVDYFKFFGNPDIQDPEDLPPAKSDGVSDLGKDSFFSPAPDGGLNLMQKAYRAYVEVVVKRYMDNKAIFSYELMNEPRCPSCSKDPAKTDFVTKWADETSAWIRRATTDPDPGLGDTNHLIGVGDEGFFNSRVQDHWPPGQTAEQAALLVKSGDPGVDGSQGVDTVALMSLPNIDYGSIHYYPGAVFVDTPRSARSMALLASRLGKPVVIGEYSVGDKVPDRAEVITSHQAVHRESVTDPLVNAKCTAGIECPAEVAAEFYWQYGDHLWTNDNTARDDRTLYSDDVASFAALIGAQAEAMFNSAPSAPTRVRKRDGRFVKNRIQ